MAKAKIHCLRDPTLKSGATLLPRLLSRGLGKGEEALAVNVFR
ncbi:MAG: hypothetical protein JWO06_851 [Bacteroidota bacterium]|nr:hypothetical protein [Bacteroidota bacterium]